MSHDLQFIIEFIVESFANLWLYLLISIPLAVAIRVTDAQRYIERIFTGHPLKMIVLATIVGAFSPFCACTVVPVIASLLIAGVPLAPVMAFWIASPSMDPEIFFLSVAMLGWPLAIARVVTTLLLSLFGGLLTHELGERRFFANGILREKRGEVSLSWGKIGQRALNTITRPFIQPASVTATASVAPTATLISLESLEAPSCGSSPDGTCGVATVQEPSIWTKIAQETWDVGKMIVQFMLIAFLLEALILLYVPQETIVSWLGTNNPLAILLAALVGIPIYTTNLTALPLISGLLEQGMAPGAALAFLIAGPTTTLPAMAAVYGIAKRRVFFIYLSLSLVGAIVFGYGYQFLISL